MDLTIKTSSNQNLELVPGTPLGVYLNLPGCKSWTAKTGNGTIYIEEIQTGPYTIRYSFFHFIKKITLYFRMLSPMAGVRFASRGKWNIGLAGQDAVSVKQNHFVLFRPVKGEKMVFEKSQEYHGVEVLCDPEKLKELMALFPGIAEFVGDGLTNPGAFIQNKPLLAPHDALAIINGRPDFRSEDLLWELFNFLMTKVVSQMNDEIPTEQEIAAVARAERLIMRDIRKHYTIPKIAKKVGLSEPRLKYAFRYQFKDSIFQYLLKARMQKAKELLLTTTRPIGEIAKLTGYTRITSFITAFHKHFTFTPGTVKRPG